MSAAKDKSYHRIQVNYIRNRIKDRIPYIDKIRAWFTAKPNYDMNHLRTLCGKLYTSESPECKGRRRTIVVRNQRCTYFVELYQPSREALQYLVENTQPPIQYFINHVEVSLDFFTDTEDHLEKIARFFRRYRVRLWHNSEWLTIVYKKHRDHLDPEMFPLQGLTYTERRSRRKGQALSPVNYITYADKPSKINGQPCCHLEVRLQNVLAVRRARLTTFDTLLHPDFFYDFWKKHLQLRIPKSADYIDKHIEKTIRKREPSTTPEKKITRYISIVSRIMKYYGRYHAQCILDAGKIINARRRFLVIVPNDHFLPPKVQLSSVR
jgi:hypothetical protein